MTSISLFDDDERTVDRPLRAYAFLAQTKHASGDLLTGLAPIFKPICRDRVGEPFDAKEFSKLVRSLYGIEVHPWAIDDLASRLEASGLLLRVAGSATEAYVYAEISGDFDAVSEADIRLIVQRFVTYAQQLMDSHEITLDAQDLEKAFLNQLVSTNFQSILLKPQAKSGTDTSSRTLSLPQSDEKIAWQEKIARQSKIDVLCASFIVDLFENDRSAYELLVRIASGALISEVILNVQDPKTDIKLNSLTVVFDGPFVMSLLDLSSEESTGYTSRIHKMLKDNGASIAVFRHSVEEIQINLKAVAQNRSLGIGFGPTARRLSNATFQAYAHSVMRDVDAAIRDLEIKIIDAPKHPSSYSYFTDADEESFRASLGFFTNPAAQTRDASSIASTIRLRRGIHVKMSQFNSSSYLFITANPWLAERAATCVKAKKINTDSEVPPALTDRFLAGLLWVVFGGKTDELTEYRLLANCTAALEARTDVIAKVQKFLGDMDETKATRFRSLMTNERAGQYLMQYTLGDAALIQTSGDAFETFDQIEQAMERKLQRRHDEALSKISEEHASKIEELERGQQSIHEKFLQAQAETLQIRDQLQGTRSAQEESARLAAVERDQKNEVIRKLVARSAAAALKVRQQKQFIISAGIGICVAIAGLFGAEYFSKNHPWLPYLGAVLAGIVAFVGVWNVPDFLFGSYLDRVRDRMFQAKLEEFDILESASNFVVDWATGAARKRDSGE